MDRKFELQLLDQYWIDGSRELLSALSDPTSHGKIALVIEGVDVSGCEDRDTDYGINQSAVALLQTVFVDHDPVEWAAGTVFAPLFFHGCSILETCPNCVIDFRVRHLADREVVLDQFYVSGGPSDSNPRRFYDKVVQLANLDYAQSILQFAKAAFAFLPPQKPAAEEYEKALYEVLRREHLELISLVEDYLQRGSITPEMKERASTFVVGM